MATLFSRFRAVGAALAASLLIAACGGGGGGGTEPPPPPPVDTTPPTVKSWTPPDGTTDIDVDQGKVAILILMNEDVTCPAKNPITITKGNGDEVKGGTYACDAPTRTLSLTFEVAALFRCETYTVTLPKGAVKDLAGNVLANDSKITVETKCPKVVMVFTGNNDDVGTWATAFSGINLVTGDVQHGWTLGASDSSSNFWSIGEMEADAKTGLVYGTDGAGRGVNILDPKTGIITNIELQPEDHFKIENPTGMAVKDANVWVAFGNEDIGSPDHQGRVFQIDRALRQVAGKTAAVTNAQKTPLRMLAHPDDAVHRVYSLNSTIGAYSYGCDFGLGIFDGACQEMHRSGTPGTVTEINSQTGAILRTFTVGSVPLGADIDPATNTMYVVNAGDKPGSLSVIDLDTGTVVTAPLLEFTGYRQPNDVKVLAGKLFITDYLDSLWAYRLDRSLIGHVALGSGASMPYRMAVANGNLQVTLNGVGNQAVAEVASSLVVKRTIFTGHYPRDIAALVSGN